MLITVVIIMLIDQVTITPEVPSRGVNRAVIKELVKLYRESHLGKRLPVYDGRKSLYTAGPLPFTSKEFVISLVDEEEGPGGARYLLLISRLWEVLLLFVYNLLYNILYHRRERQFRVVIKLASRADLHHLELFLSGKQADAPQEALQVLDIVLRELPTARYSSRCSRCFNVWLKAVLNHYTI